jgi:P-type Cu+ transporter
VAHRDVVQTIEVPISGMCCAEEAQQVQRAVASLPGVESVEIFLNSEKALIKLNTRQVTLPDIQKAVESVGCSVPTEAHESPVVSAATVQRRRVMALLGVVFGLVLFVVVVGEALGLLEAVTELVPWPVWLLLVLVAGYPIFRNVLRAARHRQIISHTLMSLGLVAALVVQEWAAALVVVFFMRLGEYLERFTTQRTRRAMKDLAALAPQEARVERGGMEHEVSVGEVQVGETVIVRPGEQIPVDGEVISGQATVDQAAITGESMPVEVGQGAKVFAATLTRLGSVRVRATRVGADTTFGRVIKLVEEAEAHRADVQRLADRFSSYYLPVVVAVALLTFLISRNPLATAAVLVVACSCSFALATPIAMLASIAAAAKHGLLVKGGKYLESLAQVDILLIDKTGTLTLGQPQITDVLTLNGASQDQILAMAASAERYSEHPLAEAVRSKARDHNVHLDEVSEFEALPGLGVRAQVNGNLIVVGNRRMIPEALSLAGTDQLEAAGKSLLVVARDGEPVGMLAATDTLRSEVPAALAAVRSLGIKHIELLTGDNEPTAIAVANELGVNYHANLLPEDKIAIVKEYQANGHKVVMVGDGVNDAPALAQADVGIAMGAVGSDVAIEASHIALLREDWTLIPEAFRVARHTMGVVKLNIGFTVVYNVVGLSLAAFGFLPLVVAAAAQSLPDLGILANSARLLRQRKGRDG